MAASDSGPDPIRTHGRIDRALCGEPTAVGPGHAEVTMTASVRMVADERGLVHGGFVFGLADHAAMLAVNEPKVVLAKAEARFLAPVREGERLVARARVLPAGEGARADRPRVEAEVTAGEGAGSRSVFSGTFHCAVPERHVLDPAEAEEGTR